MSCADAKADARAAMFAALLDRAGLSGLDSGDLAFLREAFERASRPLPLPEGFDELERPVTLSPEHLLGGEDT